MKNRLLALLLAMAVLLTCTFSLTALAVDEQPSGTVGDVNGDTSVDMKDVLVLRRFIAHLTDTVDETLADANGDESVDMKDVLLLRQYIAGWDVTLATLPETSTTEVSGESDVSGTTASADPTGTTDTTGSTDPTAVPTSMVIIPSTSTIYDSDVDWGTITFSRYDDPAGHYIEDAAIKEALQADTQKNGLAMQYVLTITGASSRCDYVYPCLMGDNGAEVWPSKEYDHEWSDASDIKYGTLEGSEFTVSSKGVELNDEPLYVYLYAENLTGTIDVTHVKIEAIRPGGTSYVTVTTRTTTTKSNQSGTTRTTIGPTSANYTYVGDKPYLTFRAYGDECTLGTWWWGNRGDPTYDQVSPTTCDTYLQFLYMNGVDEIYFYGYYWTANSGDRAKLHSFVQKANEKGMAVSLIYDDADTICSSGNREMTTIANNYLAYCSAYPSDDMAGIHFDVEGVSRDSMVTNMISQFAAARERGVPIAMDVNCNWTSSKTLNGVTGFMNIAAANLDCLSLMSYMDTAGGIWDLGNKYAFSAAKTYGTKIVFGVETGHYTFNEDSNEFYQEGAEKMYDELAKLFTRLQADHPTGGYGIAIHQVVDWYNLKNK